MTTPLALLTELLIMWLVPNFFLGWKRGGGGGLQTYEKWTGQYVPTWFAFVFSFVWVLIVNFALYPIVGLAVENFYLRLDIIEQALVILIIFVLGYVVFKKQRWS